MARKLVRTAVGLAVMASAMTIPVAASAESVRPGQSVVSAERAATAPSPFEARQTQQRAGAEMQDANQAVPSKFFIIFLAMIPVGWAFWKIISP